MAEQQQQPQEADSPEEGESLVLASPDEASSPKDFLLWAGVIVLAVLTVYSPALRGKFLWDDDRHVEANPNLRDAAGLARIWTKLGPHAGGTIQYYPLTHTTFWIEYQFVGGPGEVSTTIFHLTNMLLHAAGAILMWFVLRELRVPGAWVAAAIFALHPIEVESVAWISERKNVLAGVFFFATILVYLRSERDPRLYWAAVGFFLCAALSKTMTVTLPAILLIITWWQQGRIGGKDLARTAPMFLAGLGLAQITRWVEATGVGARGADWDLSFVQRILIAGRAVWFYACKLIWPHKLTFIYPRWDVDPTQVWQWIFPIGVVAMFIVFWLMRNRIGRGPAAAWAIFVCALVPAMGFVNFYPMRFSFVADHFQYFAGPALITLIVAVVTLLLRRVRADMSTTPLPYAIAGALLLALSVLTAMQSRIFGSHRTLWADTVAKNPSAWLAQHNLAVTFSNEAAEIPRDRIDDIKQLTDDAARHFAKAIELRPNYDRAYTGWGQLLMFLEKPADAIAKLDRALAIEPRNTEALNTRATALMRLNKPAEAKGEFEKILAIASTQPNIPRNRQAAAHYNLACIADTAGDTATANKHFEQAVALAPRQVSYRYDYSKLLNRIGERNKAAVQLAATIEMQPENIDAHIDLALMMMDVGNLRGSQQQLAEATALAGRFNSVPPRLEEAVKKWSAAYEASTRPSTTRASTTRASTAQAATTRSTTTTSTAPATTRAAP